MKAQPVLKWSHLTVSRKITKARAIVSAMTNNSNFMPPNLLPDPSLATIAEAANALEKAESDVMDNGGGKKLTNIRDNKELALDALMSTLQKFVDYTAKGDSEIILSAAFDVKRPPSSKGGSGGTQSKPAA